MINVQKMHNTTAEWNVSMQKEFRKYIQLIQWNAHKWAW